MIALPHWARNRNVVVQRVAGGEPAAVSTIVWYEFLIGPLDPREADLARAFVQGRVIAIEEADAEIAAELFNAVGRHKGLKTDALIAAMAIRADAELVTLNARDFLPFTEHGLRLFDGDLSL